MKRIGHVIEEIVSQKNLEESFRYVLRGTKRKKSRSGKYLLKNKDTILTKIRKTIESGNYKIPKYKELKIIERGKERIIQSIPLYDRIAVHAIMRIVEKYLNRRFIADSAASIKGRGGLYLIRRMLKDMKSNPSETIYIYKLDIKKYYQSIPQDTLINVIGKCFKDKKLIKILEGFIKLLPKGISIGLRSSQVLGNLLLDYYLDHYVKDRLGIKYYRRYCDDIVVQAGSLYSLTWIIREIKKRLSLIPGIEIKSNDQVYKITNRCIDFLGYQFFGTRQIKIRKHIKKRFAKRWKRVRSIRRKQELIAAFYAITKHAHAKNLFYKLTGIKMNNFADFGLIFVSKDGKKQFDVVNYSLGDLQNRKLIVENFAKGITTKEGAGRYVVKFRFAENEGGDISEGKYFTNSEEMKQMLDKIEEIKGFPFQTTIKRQVFGKRKIKYTFT